MRIMHKLSDLQNLDAINASLSRAVSVANAPRTFQAERARLETLSLVLSSSAGR